MLSRFFPYAILAGVLALLLWQTNILASLDDYREDIVYLTWQHIKLVTYSGTLALITAIPIGIILSRPRFSHVAESVMQFLNIGATVPTLAILALAMTFLGVGLVPAVFGLWVTTILPMVRNTYTALLGVPFSLKEAAIGQGMTPAQILFKAELPNAAPIIVAGIRTAIAINIGTAPLAFLIGGGGLGELIFTGIDVDNSTMMLAGAIPTALLAVVFDASIAALAYLSTSKGLRSPSPLS
ncbi:ABC transporter permease [Alcaligenes nematophilus]|uniref:ABC transporter permease n=1 Tax=Alcaligenes nematophilus TaxID=2994643 RepID=UPI00245FEAAE|nr:ABC transporter permease [Alcaligenes nematophilus]MDH4865418.1 ABC transporter permease [Bacillus cereus]MDY7126717.1 ABC transporter permease [Alcaligenes nematophilus]